MIKIREYLRSGDIEMVRLGVSLMKEMVPKKHWQFLLEDCLIPKYKYKIEDTEIEIYEMDYFGEGVWSQLDKGSYTHKYSIDSFNLETMTEAIKEFMHGKEDSNNQLNNRI